MNASGNEAKLHIRTGRIREEKFQLRDLNFRLILYVTLLSVAGILFVNSATANEVTQSVVSTTTKQIIGVVAGIVMMVGMAFIDYHKYVKYAFVLYILAAGLLVYLLVFGQSIYGARRWLYFPFFGTIQPSEFAKPALILALTFVLYKAKDKINKFWVLLIYFGVTAPILGMVLMEPDLSTAIVLFIVMVSMLFLGGISYKWVLGVTIAVIPLIALFFIALYQPGQEIFHLVLKDHQVERINAFFFPENHPDVIRQQNNSVMAIASGGFFGKGIGNSSLDSVKNGNFLSEEQCDFIFAVIGEETGFFGSFIILSLIALTVFECFRTAHKANDTAGKLLAAAAGASIGFQSLINIGVALLLIPNTGIPLPFLSAGLSSLLSSYILIGFVLSVGLYGKLKRRVFV